MKEHATLIDPDNAAEMARRINQEQWLIQVAGLWPYEIDEQPQPIKTVLDLGCGPGHWASMVAFAHPDISVTGVDSFAVVEYAQANADVQKLSNIKFVKMDLSDLPLQFPDGTFDLISARFLSELLDCDSWPLIFAECLRLLRPSGVFCLTEEELVLSNSLALQKMYWCLYRTLAVQNKSYSVDMRSRGICPKLPRLMKQAMFRDVTCRAFHIESSAGTPLHIAVCQNQEIALTLMEPALQRAGVLEGIDYQDLFQQIQTDMRGEDFVAVSFGLQVWGYK